VLCTGAYQARLRRALRARRRFALLDSPLSFVGSDAMLALLVKLASRKGRDYTRVLIYPLSCRAPTHHPARVSRLPGGP